MPYERINAIYLSMLIRLEFFALLSHINESLTQRRINIIVQFYVIVYDLYINLIVNR